MKTVILTLENRGDRTPGAWLRDLGFNLIEAGCEINLTRAEGDKAREILIRYGLEVAQVVEGFGPRVQPTPPTSTPEPVRRAASTHIPGYQPHERYGGAEGSKLS